MVPGPCPCLRPVWTFVPYILEPIDSISSPCPDPGPISVRCEYTISVRSHRILSKSPNHFLLYAIAKKLTVNSPKKDLVTHNFHLQRDFITKTKFLIFHDVLGAKRINKECRSIVGGESVYLTMLSGHSRHTHSVSVPNISVLLHTHVEAVLKFEVVSHFAHFWSYFSTNFHIWPTKSKLRASSTTWRCFCYVLVPVRGWKTAKTWWKLPTMAFFAFFQTSPLQHGDVFVMFWCLLGGERRQKF